MKNVITYFVHGRNVEIPVEYAHLVRMKRRDEIAKEYDISERDLRTIIRESGLKISRKHLLLIEDIIEIYLVMGWPVKMYLPVQAVNSLTFNHTRL